MNDITKDSKDLIQIILDQIDKLIKSKEPEREGIRKNIETILSVYINLRSDLINYSKRS